MSTLKIHPSCLVLALLLAVSAPQLAAAGGDGNPAAEAQPGHLVTRFQHDVAALQPWLERYGAGVVFAAIFVEGVGVPAPGLTFLVAGTVAASAGKGPPLGFLLLGAFLAAAVGNSLGYSAGRLGGRALLRRLRVDERRLEPLERAFRKWGGWFILVARFVDGPKQLNGIAAGILAMPWQTFTVFNALGAALWVGFFGLGTYYVDRHVHEARVFLHHLNPWTLAAAAVGTLFVLWWFLGRGRRRGRPTNE